MFSAGAKAISALHSRLTRGVRPRLEGKPRTPLSSRVATRVSRSPPERPQGSPASSSVWREDPGLLSRPCRKRRPSSRDDGGVSCVFSSCGASVGCLMKYHGDLREPLVWRQENPVFHSSCKLELGIALQSLQGKIDLIYACVQDLVFHYWADRDLRVAFSTHPESQASS